jgi:hypothetical protein
MQSSTNQISVFKQWSLWLVVVVLTVGIGNTLTGCGKKDNAVVQESKHITLAKYDKIQVGMLRDQVEKTISPDGMDNGDAMSVSEIQKMKDHPEADYEITYRADSQTRFATITYNDGGKGADSSRVVKKVQYNLE